MCGRKLLSFPPGDVTTSTSFTTLTSALSERKAFISRIELNGNWKPGTAVGGPAWPNGTRGPRHWERPFSRFPHPPPPLAATPANNQRTHPLLPHPAAPQGPLRVLRTRNTVQQGKASLDSRRGRGVRKAPGKKPRRE